MLYTLFQPVRLQPWKAVQPCWLLLGPSHVVVGSSEDHHSRPRAGWRKRILKVDQFKAGGGALGAREALGFCLGVTLDFCPNCCHRREKPAPFLSSHNGLCSSWWFDGAGVAQQGCASPLVCGNLHLALASLISLSVNAPPPSLPLTVTFPGSFLILSCP